ncbi:uncharacterized protein LOC119209526 [Pungitius pungitius]|uniref:uncharacterized protein LOC119209526 n=1 Tax=Pungitius pungitius TaxID=134920 RepID=UPI002E10769C
MKHWMGNMLILTLWLGNYLKLLILSLLLGFSCQELKPVKTEENSVEDTTVTLSYIYSKQATGSDYFFWYRQYPGKPPKFLISHSATGTVGINEIDGLNVKVDGNRISLNLPSAAVSDSAVYYCAVRPTGSMYEASTSPSFKMLSSLMLLVILKGFSCEELKPVKTEENGVEDTTVTLSCNYSSQFTDYFFWYRQFPGKSPDFLIGHVGRQHAKSSRLSVKVSDDKTRMDLNISSAAVSDSAVYYCAVKPTVTGNTTTLYKNPWSKDNNAHHPSEGVSLSISSAGCETSV